METVASDTVAPAAKPAGITTDRAAAIIAFGCILFLAGVRAGFAGVLRP